MRLPLFSAAVLLLAFGAATAQAQTSDTAATRWYDTLTVTEARYARVTPLEGLALSAFLAISVPVAAAIALTTTLPPSVVVLRDGGVDRAGIALSSGLGFGVAEGSELMWFPVARLQGEIAYFPAEDLPTLMRASALLDYRFGSIDRRNLFWFGIAGGPGVSTDFRSISPFGELFIGLSNPLGINHYPYRPMHHLGLRFRTGYDPVASRIWHEGAFAITSTFGM